MIKYKIDSKDKEKTEEALRKQNLKAKWEDNYLIVSDDLEDGMCDILADAEIEFTKDLLTKE